MSATALSSLSQVRIAAVDRLVLLGWQQSSAQDLFDSLVDRALAAGVSVDAAVRTAYAFCVPTVPAADFPSFRALVLAGVDPFDAYAQVVKS